VPSLFFLVIGQIYMSDGTEAVPPTKTNIGEKSSD
jgi:hypothetical protein